MLSSCLEKEACRRPTGSELLMSSAIQLQAFSTTGLLAFESFESKVHHLYTLKHRDLCDEDDDEYEAYGSIRKDASYITFISNIDFSVGLDWEELEEDMPEVGEYLGSDIFQQILKRYQNLADAGKDKTASTNETKTHTKWDF